MKIGQMWKLVILLALTITTGNTQVVKKSSQNDALLTMRLAQEDDLDAVMDVFQEMSPLDQQSLIILPGEHQRKFVLKAIQCQHLFVALSEKQKIVAILKIFLITEQHVLQHILRNELRILPWNNAVSPVLLESRFLHIRRDDIANFSFSIDRTETPRLATPAESDWSTQKMAAVYCGSCFTRDKYREKKIASRLEEFAFASIRPQIIEHLATTGASHICLLFGKVQAMYTHQGLIRSFMTCISQTPQLIRDKSCISLFAWSFLATLPKFELDTNGNLIEKQLPVDKWRDYGCAFIYDVV